MKLITWNCNGGFRNKYHLLADNFDILIIQECENPNHSTKEYKDLSDEEREIVESFEGKDSYIKNFHNNGLAKKEDEQLLLFG